MYNSKIFCIFLTITISIGLIFNANVAADTVSVSTSSDIYYQDDHVVVFGVVDTVFEDIPITIQTVSYTHLTLPTTAYV